MSAEQKEKTTSTIVVDSTPYIFSEQTQKICTEVFLLASLIEKKFKDAVAVVSVPPPPPPTPLSKSDSEEIEKIKKIFMLVSSSSASDFTSSSAENLDRLIISTKTVGKSHNRTKINFELRALADFMRNIYVAHADGVDLDVLRGTTKLIPSDIFKKLVVPASPQAKNSAAKVPSSFVEEQDSIIEIIDDRPMTEAISKEIIIPMEWDSGSMVYSDSAADENSIIIEKQYDMEGSFDLEEALEKLVEDEEKKVEIEDDLIQELEDEDIKEEIEEDLEEELEDDLIEVEEEELEDLELEDLELEDELIEEEDAEDESAVVVVDTKKHKKVKFADKIIEASYVPTSTKIYKKGEKLPSRGKPKKNKNVPAVVLANYMKSFK